MEPGNKSPDLEIQPGTSKIVAGFLALFTLFLIVASVVSIYREGALLVPGLTPAVYKANDPVTLLVNKVTSIKAPIPYRYHDLPVCSPAADKIVSMNDNLGQVLLGNRLENSLYELTFLKDDSCHLLCEKPVNAESLAQLSALIQDQYMVHWQMDGLPVATKAYSANKQEEVMEIGFPLGFKADDGLPQKSDLNNHVHIVVHYSRHTPVGSDTNTAGAVSEWYNSYNIIMFEVEPYSASYGAGRDSDGGPMWATQCKSGRVQPLDVLNTKPDKIVYTYSVSWKLSEVKWANRWHEYLALQGDGQVHWFSIINSVMIVFFLSGMVAMIMTRILHRDFRRYSEQDPEEVEETGWKTLSRDVFRPPIKKMFFSVLIGSGAQVFGMTVVTAIFGVLGFVSPANQGSIVTSILVLYVWMGALAGYSSTRIYQYLDGERQTRNTIFTALFFPGVLFVIVCILNTILWVKHSSGAFPFLNFLAIMALWAFISLPLTFLGSRIALRREKISIPIPYNHIERVVPEQPWYMSNWASILMGGILPFGAVFIELYFIMSSIWLHRYYYLFGFLFLVFLILVVTCAEISIVMVYFQLVALDYNWWWRSYLTSGASAVYMFLYAIIYFVNTLDIEGLAPAVIYFGYSAMISLFFFVLTGSIGFYASHWFVRTIYKAIHND